MIQVNEYFDGTVKSLAYTSAEGKSTIGVFESGEYSFGTSTRETMTIIEGEVVVLLPGATDWETFTNGQSFDIPSDVMFKIKTTCQTSYLCKYK